MGIISELSVNENFPGNMVWFHGLQFGYLISVGYRYNYLISGRLRVETTIGHVRKDRFQEYLVKELLNRFLIRIAGWKGNGNTPVFSASQKPTYAARAEKLLLEDLNAIYVVIPKTGCTSVKKFFSNYYGLKEMRDVHDPASEIYKYIFHDDLQQQKYLKYFVFTFVRNPFPRLYSAYKSKVGGEKENPRTWIEGVAPGLYKMGVRKDHSFREFVEIVCTTEDHRSDPHVKSQWQFIVSNDGELLVDKYYRFENFQKDFSALLINLGITTPASLLPHENRSQLEDDEYTKYFDEYLSDLVIKRYKKDFEFFGYSEKPQVSLALT